MKDNVNNYWQVSGWIAQKLNNNLPPAEEAQLNEWLNADPENQEMFNRLLNEGQRAKDLELMGSFDTKLAFEQVAARFREEEKNHRRSRRSWLMLGSGVAAAVILVLMAIALLYPGKKSDQRLPVVATTSKVVSDSDQVLLTLAGGEKIALETADAGVLQQQNGTTITKSAKGLQYQAVDKQIADASAPVAYNSLYVPKGKRYQLVLPDGTKVWLNAHTSLKYPVAFNGPERLIELNGEAYFEVAQQAKQPFKVSTGTQTVEVLGTHFNVEAYPGEGKVLTTLAEGRVRVRKDNTAADMRPGQMVINDLTSAKLLTRQADLSTVLAWKEGLFYFKDERIEEIMKKVSRAYNVTIEYKTDAKDKRFWATYPIENGLANFLKRLEQAGDIHFDVQPGKIIVK